MIRKGLAAVWKICTICSANKFVGYHSAFSMNFLNAFQCRNAKYELNVEMPNTTYKTNTTYKYQTQPTSCTLFCQTQPTSYILFSNFMVRKKFDYNTCNSLLVILVRSTLWLPCHPSAADPDFSTTSLLSWKKKVCKQPNVPNNSTFASCLHIDTGRIV